MRYARVVELDDVRVGRAKVKNVKALVLERDLVQDCDGLLGMSFLSNFLFEIDTNKNVLILKCKPED